jgi:Uma2 family endonuclease
MLAVGDIKNVSRSWLGMRALQNELQNEEEIVMLDTLVPVGEYLSTAYNPDVDYVEGQLEDRNMGEREHGELQARIWLLLKQRRILQPFIETRLMISPNRYRVPDICAYDKKPEESIFTRPPALCVEIISPEDRMSRIMNVVRDYLSMGVPTVWVLDPLEKKAYVAEGTVSLRETSGSIATSDGRVTLELATVFSDEELIS